MAPAHPPLDPEERDWSNLGLRASARDRAAYRDELERSPDDPRLRTILAAWAAPRALLGNAAAEAAQHLEWFAAHRPASRTMTVLCAMLANVSDPSVRARADAVLGILAGRTGSATVLGNVAQYFRIVDPRRARDLLERAKGLEPDLAAQWDQRIEQLGAERDVLGVRGRAATERAIGRALPTDVRRLSRGDLEALERRLVGVPDDLVARHALVSAYGFLYVSGLQAGGAEAATLRARMVEHLGWLIENAPGSKETGEVAAGPAQRMDPSGYADLSARWERTLAARAGDARAHANAARFYALGDPGRALELLERAAELEPDEPEWSRGIAQQVERMARRASPAERSRHRRRALVELERAAAHEARRGAGSEAGRRLLAGRFTLPQLARAALAAGELDRAEQIGRELVEAAPAEAWMRAFDGRAHEGHLVLGLVALRRGDAGAAVRHLREATGSPFPFRAGWKGRTALARDLFDAGEREAVRAYLEASLRDAEKAARGIESADASAFTGRDEVAAWLAALDAGERPAFPRDDP